MTKYYVYFLDGETAEVAREANGDSRKPFASAQEAVAWAKNRANDTDGSFVLQVIGFDCGHPVFTKTISAKENNRGKMRGYVL